MPSRLAAAALLIAGVSAMPASNIHARNPPVAALPENAPANAIAYQPVLDYDTDSCYNVAAIDASGACTQGLSADWTTNTAGCRDISDLNDQNVYVRSRCNNGYCAYMYEHYFQKDVAVEHLPGFGHKHEWENVVVVVKDGQSQPAIVAASQHSGYETKLGADVRFQGTNPKIVYNKDGVSTHDFRFANAGDDKIENAKGIWIRGALVDWNGFPSTAIRDKMVANWADTGITVKLAEVSFASYLTKAIGDRAPGFNVNIDG